MTRNAAIILGQYRPLDSYLHRLDARSKIIPVLCVLVLALLTHSLYFYISLLVLLGGALLNAGVGVRNLLTNLRPIGILVTITMLYHLVFSGAGGDILWQLGSLTVTSGGLSNAAFFSLRLLLFVAVAFLITLTNSPSELAEAFGRTMAPLARLGLPVGELAMILFIAIRFIPILHQEFVVIRNAQRIRGVDFSGSWLSRLRRTSAIIVPVFMAASQRADELALAIEARGYDGRRPRTAYSRSRFGAQEWLFTASVSAGVLVLFFVSK
ncbi:MAG: energy-coupling factor transporter transmembrane component T [bacterium]